MNNFLFLFFFFFFILFSLFSILEGGRTFDGGLRDFNLFSFFLSKLQTKASNLNHIEMEIKRIGLLFSATIYP